MSMLLKTFAITGGFLNESHKSLSAHGSVYEIFAIFSNLCSRSIVSDDMEKAFRLHHSEALFISDWNHKVTRLPTLWCCECPHQGIQHSEPYFCPASFSSRMMRSAWIWNRVLCEGRLTSYMPLGYATPSLVPWPPASSRTATLFSDIRFSPVNEQTNAQVTLH